MREKFEQTLRAYSVAVKREQQPLEKLDGASESTENDLADLEALFASAAFQYRNDPEAQQKIFNLQKSKQDIMNSLHRKLKALDHPEMKVPHVGKRVRREDGAYVCELKSGETMPVTLGELLTDGDWGLKYDLDPETVPRSVRKRYLVEDAKRKLRSFLDQQIMQNEISSEATHWKKKKAYTAFRNVNMNTETMPEGVLAEMMVRNFMKKAALDNKLPFDIHEADVYMDVEQKIDFILQRIQHKRGIQVEEGEQDIGIQFTTNPKAVDHKQYQIDQAKRQRDNPVDDILLVLFPAKKAKSIFQQWKRTGKQSGGPDALWDEETKHLIFTTLLKGIESEKQINKEWNMVVHGLKKPSKQSETPLRQAA